MILLIVGGDGLSGEDLLVEFLSHVGAKVGAQIVLQAGIAAGTYGLSGLLYAGIHIGLASGGQSVALLLGGVVEHGDLSQTGQALIQEVVIPSGAGLLVLDLVLGVHAGVKTGVHAHLSIVQGLSHGVVVIILNDSGSKVLAVNGHSGGTLLEKAAVPHQQGDGQNGDDNADHAIDHVHAAAFFLRFVVAPLGISRALAGLLFSGCTHS